MSRRRKPNSGDPRKRKPDAVAQRAASAYRCGHCRSRSLGVTVDQYGINHLNIGHDPSCPVLLGTVDDAPDVLRAAAAAEGPLVVVLGDFEGGGEE
ncbi:hypothetical protein [Streptomyces kanamyceticus]|uniref:Uncharacterized protein n=1 Tax=Streptomyces kanamyceticus TaxID=1967 RepID=A0A5J6GBK2_STRKN|nr:hypothetical protein [Streptomyces kanamyceticus]QEU91375.1 hypothetical protein CP970_11190 [Streptomyces kanamyceticus]